MTDHAKKLHLVDADEVFEYPIPVGERLDSHSFITWKFDWWLNSEFRLRADKDVRAVGFDLFCIAQKQDPVGTIPQDELLLAKLTGESLEDWRRLMDRPITPLYNWKPCICSDGKTRLYHDTVLKIAAGAIGRREDHEEQKAEDRKRKRLKALPDLMVRAGAASGMAESEITVARFDQFLDETFPKRRRSVALIRQALEQYSLENLGGLNVPTKRF